jgi:tetratricopeptide (TPR) repeat protein
MTILSEQLEAIFLEIKSNFGQHRQIKVLPQGGSPPEQYRITYHLRGLCKETGAEVKTCTEHIVLLNIPFGFPHFPPNCKPETPVFHPDFDQAAICISDFWENNQSLSGLIIHIGRMVCGEIYSTTNAFNEEAAIWYKENEKDLPLDTVDPTSAETSPSHPHQPAEGVSEPLTIDTVDDIFFPDNGNHATDDRDRNKQPGPALSELSPETVADSPLSLEDSSPSSQGAPSDPGLKREEQDQLKEARKKHHEGEAFEHQGQPARALDRYQTVKTLAPDFPEIDKDIARAQYSVEMLGDLVADDSPQNKSAATKKGTAAKSPKKSAPEKAPAVPVQGQQGRSSRWPTRAIGVGVGALLLILISVYLNFNAQFKQATMASDECKQLVENGQLSDAEGKCAQALQQTSKIQFIKQEEKKLLVQKIKQIQDSDKFQQALATKGNDPNTMVKWQESLKLASKHMADGQWQEALTGYTHTLELISDSTTIDRAILDQIQNNKATAEFNIALEAGKQAMAASEWDLAKNHLNSAMAIARKNPHIPPTNLTKIKSILGQIELNTLVASGDTYLAKGDWDSALTVFEKAQEIEKAFPASDPSSRSALAENIIRTKIFTSLEQGTKAFAEAQWDQAINHYKTARQLLDENSELLNRENPHQSTQKISRLIVHAAVIRDMQGAANHLKNKEFSEAINKLQAVMETINQSPFASEQEFQAITKEARISASQAQEELLISEHISYLTSNYQKLLTQNNPSLAPENLSNPRISFLKKIGNKSVYKIQCVELGHGSPVLIQASYFYDPATRKWSFYRNDASINEPEAELSGQKILAATYQAQENRLIAEQITYLKENSQTLFIQENPSLRPENLTRPEAAFQRKIGEKLLFTLQCLHREADKSTPLKINFLYNSANNKLEPYDTKPAK